MENWRQGSSATDPFDYDEPEPRLQFAQSKRGRLIQFREDPIFWNAYQQMARELYRKGLIERPSVPQLIKVLGRKDLLVHAQIQTSNSEDVINRIASNMPPSVAEALKRILGERSVT